MNQQVVQLCDVLRGGGRRQLIVVAEDQFRLGDGFVVAQRPAATTRARDPHHIQWTHQTSDDESRPLSARARELAVADDSSDDG